MKIFLCLSGDNGIRYESEKYRMQKPVSFVNWVTTDMLKHPNEPLASEDQAVVNMEHIKQKDTFKSGLFASYHIYPYYPDSMSYQREYANFRDAAGKPDTYRAYLQDLKKQHTMPVLVAEFGVPSSRGKAHENIVTGFNQGNISEADQGGMDKIMLQDIYEEGYAGGLVFSFQDEWFKKTWNTMALDLPDRRPYWDNVQTNEQHFGVLAFDPGATGSACEVDGDIGEWQDSQPVYQDADRQLFIKSDEAYVYFLVKDRQFDISRDKLHIPLDTIDGQGNLSQALGKFSRAADFLIVIDGQDRSRIMVDAYYDSFQYLYGDQLKMIPDQAAYHQQNSGMFVPMYLCLSPGGLAAPGQGRSAL